VKPKEYDETCVSMEERSLIEGHVILTVQGIFAMSGIVVFPIKEADNARAAL